MNKYFIDINGTTNFIIDSYDQFAAVTLLKKLGIDLELLSKKNKISIIEKGISLDEYGNKIEEENIEFINTMKLNN